MTSRNKMERSYSCSVCGKKLSSSVALAAHLKIHSGIKSFCCEYCGALYSTKQNLMAHLLRIHEINQDTIITCDICGKHFFRKCAFDNHYLIHLDEKPFNCHICNRYFRQKVTRDLHVATHSGDYKFSCSKCGRKFLSSYKYKQHMEKKKGLCSNSSSEPTERDLNSEDNTTDEGVNSFDCHLTNVENQTCEKSFSNSNKDSSNSAEFSCTGCGKQFKSLQGLEYHKKAHEGFYNFICDICGRLFIRNSHFVSHMKTHSDMRPYFCSLCMKTYKSNKNLKEHIRLKHSTG